MRGNYFLQESILFGRNCTSQFYHCKRLSQNNLFFLSLFIVVNTHTQRSYWRVSEWLTREWERVRRRLIFITCEFLSKQKTVLKTTQSEEYNATKIYIYSQMHISCLSLSLPHSLTHFRIIYVRAYIHDEHYCILFPLLHFIQRILPLLKFVISSSSSSSSLFFCYKRWNFSSIEITAAAAFFAGREKRNFLFPFIVWCVFVMRMMMRRQKKLLLHLILIHHRGKCDSVSGDGRQCSLNPMLPSGRLHIFSYC